MSLDWSLEFDLLLMLGSLSGIASEHVKQVIGLLFFRVDVGIILNYEFSFG